MTQKQRSKEVRENLALDTDELVKRAKGQLILFPTLDEVYDYLAEEMVNEFQKAAEGDKIVSFIMPVGPTQPYRLMAEKINYRQLNLKNVRFFFMDEYVDDTKDKLIPMTNPLSFRGQIGPLLFNRIRPDLLMPKKQIIFPTPASRCATAASASTGTWRSTSRGRAWRSPTRASSRSTTSRARSTPRATAAWAATWRTSPAARSRWA